MTNSAAARRRRRTRLRSTAFPTFRLTVNPMRKAGGAPFAPLFDSAAVGWGLTCRIRPGATHLRPWAATARNSRRRLRRGRALTARQSAACGPSCDGWTILCGHRRSPCASETRAGAYGPGGLVEMCVSRVNSVNGLGKSRVRCIRAPRSEVNAHPTRVKMAQFQPFHQSVMRFEGHWSAAGGISAGPSRNTANEP